MGRTNLRLRIDGAGNLEVVDPGLDVVDLLRSLDPAFTIRRDTLPDFRSPRFLATRDTGIGLPTATLATAPGETLEAAHAEVMARLREEGGPRTRETGEASLLDLKIEIAWRLLTRCELCAHRCGVDRTQGERGVCGLGTGAQVAEHFVHIAEEPPVNPSLVLNLAGCGLRCRYCQQGEILDPRSVAGVPLDASLWADLGTEGARSLSFVGGNPDESLYAVLRFLAAAPPDWSLPIVWNCHAYSTVQVLQLLAGVVDAYIPDFKYGNEECGRRLAGGPGYPAVATSAIAAMAAQGVPVIVRILVLPGHVDCCHVPSLGVLAPLAGIRSLQVSIRDQYCPDWRVGPGDGPLGRRPTHLEVERAREAAAYFGLCLVDGGT